MVTPSFASLEEAWIDLSSHLDPLYVELLGKDMRDFFYAGATTALTLIAMRRLPELERDLKRFGFEEKAQ